MYVYCMLYCPHSRSNAETLHSGTALTSVVSAAAAAAAVLGVGASAAIHNSTTHSTSMGLFGGDVAGITSDKEVKPIMLVFIVGGLSFLEVAAFRFLSKDASFPYSIVMATTKMINGKSFLHSMQHECVEPR